MIFMRQVTKTSGTLAGEFHSLRAVSAVKLSFALHTSHASMLMTGALL
jgi:hypothetical protein